MACTDVQTIQAGNGTKTQFSFNFPYIFKSEIHVYFWNVTTKIYDEILTTDAVYPWQITDANPTVVEFTGTAPPSPAAPTDPNEPTVDNVKIERITKIDDIRALFNPGSAIRSDDLNKNFEQLRYAIQEAKCVEIDDAVLNSYLVNYYWNKFNNTVYSTETWDSDDDKVATTQSIDARVDSKISSSLSTIPYTYPSGVSRTVGSRLQDSVSVNDFGAVIGTDQSNAAANTTAFNNALTAAAGRAVRVKAGTYVVNGPITIPSNTALIGEGTFSTKLLASSTLSAATTVIDMSNVSGCMVAFITVDGNTANRGTGGGNNIMIRGSNNAVYSVNTINSPNAGILIDGQTYTADLNRVAECTIEDNKGVGLSQHTARQTFITSNQFARNGFENLTIDNTSHGTIAVGNRFFKHLGGCGNIGWDDSDASVFSSNYIDNENSTDASVGNRNGVCINSEAQVNTIAVISTNVIINCNEIGIFLRDRSGQTPAGYKPGSCAITGNIIESSGSSDIKIGATEQTITVKGNNYTSIVVDDPETDVRLGSGEVGLEAAMSTNQSFSLSSTFSQVNFDTVTTSRLVTRSGNVYTLPAGGFYNINIKVRFTGLTAAGNPTVSLRVNFPGGSKIINESTAGGDHEVDMSFTRLMGKGDVSVDVRTFGGSGSVTLEASGETYLTCVLVG